MSKYNSIEEILKAKDALLNNLLAPALDAQEGFTVMQTLRKNILQNFMNNSWAHGTLAFNTTKTTVADLILGLNGDKDKLVEMLFEYMSESIDLYEDITKNLGPDVPKSTLDALFLDEFHPDLLEVFDQERKMFKGDPFLTNFNLSDGSKHNVGDRDIYVLIEEIIKNETFHGIRHVMPEGYEMRTLMESFPEIHAEFGRLRDQGIITQKQLDDLFTVTIQNRADWEGNSKRTTINGWDEYGEALKYLQEEFQIRATEYVMAIKNNNRFYSDPAIRTGDKYFSLIGLGSSNDSMYNTFYRGLREYVMVTESEVRNTYYKEMVTDEVKKAGFLSESDMLEYAAGRDNLNLMKIKLTPEEVNDLYNNIVTKYEDLVEARIDEKLGNLEELGLIKKQKHSDTFPSIDVAVKETISNPELVNFVEDIEPSQSTLADVLDENQKIFDAGEDLPIDANVLQQQVGGRQLGFGQDELDIIEGTAFKEIMDDMDARNIHYSDIDIYSYIPENKRLSPYLIFQMGVRNEYFTPEFVDYLIKASARGAFKSNPNLDFNAASSIHEYALKGAYAQGPRSFGEMLLETVLDKFNPRGGISSGKLEINYINEIFPGGSYKANVEESNRRFWEDKGMTPEGEWLPEVQQQIDEKVAFDDLKNVFEMSDDVPDTPTNVPEQINVDELVEVKIQITDPDGLHARPTGEVAKFLENNNLTAYIKDSKGVVKPFSFLQTLQLGIKKDGIFSIFFSKDTDTKPFVDNMINLDIGDEVDARGSTIRTGTDVLSNHSERVRGVATDYHSIMGLDSPEFKPAAVFSETLGQVSAQLFDELPLFDEAALPFYKKFIQETNIQYQLLLDAGIEFELVDYDPYTPNRSGHNQMIADMENGRLKILSTEAGMGDSVPDTRNPMTVQSKYTDVNGRVMLENDVFRAVHDTFGHGMRGNTFGPVGEYNAWLAHKEMYSRDAQRAMTTETLGQNTYTNYGPHMQDANGNMIPEGDPNYVRPQDRPFAENKTALVPEELIDAAGTVVEDVADLVETEAMNKLDKFVNQNPGVANKLWKESKKIVGRLLNTVGTVFDPGDLVITQGLYRLLPRLGASAIATPALIAYVFYELSVLAVDVNSALSKANQNIEKQGQAYSFTGGKTLDGEDINYQPTDWKQFGSDFWSEFGDVSDTYSLSWKISEPIINKAFESYGTLDSRLTTAAPYSYYGTMGNK